MGDGSTRAFVSDAPVAIRDDLRRALCSNSMVDAQGETDARRRALPPSVLATSRAGVPHTAKSSAHAMYGSKAAPPDSHAALEDAWSLVYPGLMAYMRSLLLPTDGLETVRMKINAPQNLALHPPVQLGEWLGRVINSFHVMPTATHPKACVLPTRPLDATSMLAC